LRFCHCLRYRGVSEMESYMQFKKSRTASATPLRLWFALLGLCLQ
jgi:hypothetical protein